jgi:hypothetical protein
MDLVSHRRIECFLGYRPFDESVVVAANLSTVVDVSVFHAEVIVGIKDVDHSNGMTCLKKATVNV